MGGIDLENLVKLNLECPYLDILENIHKTCCTNCDSGYIEETSESCSQTQKILWKSDLNSKLEVHALETNHTSEFENAEILYLNSTNYSLIFPGRMVG